MFLTTETDRSLEASGLHGDALDQQEALSQTKGGRCLRIGNNVTLSSLFLLARVRYNEMMQGMASLLDSCQWGRDGGSLLPTSLP